MKIHVMNSNIYPLPPCTKILLFNLNVNFKNFKFKLGGDSFQDFHETSGLYPTFVPKDTFDFKYREIDDFLQICIEMHVIRVLIAIFRVLLVRKPYFRFQNEPILIFVF